jgi:predicted transcriptional regulator
MSDRQALTRPRRTPFLTEADVLSLAARVVSAFTERNHINPQDLPQLILDVVKVFRELEGRGDVAAPIPAVPIKKSISDEFIVCLEDGKKLRTLKRYLSTRYGLSIEAYKTKWGLPGDYPACAPAYARLRSRVAKRAGLGRTPRRRT